VADSGHRNYFQMTTTEKKRKLDTIAGEDQSSDKKDSKIDFWKTPIVLKGKKITLVPLKKDHWPTLFKLQDPLVWYYMPSLPQAWREEGLTYEQYVEHNTKLLDDPHWHCWTVVDNESGEPVGNYNLIDLQPAHSTAEIGAIWLTKSARGKGFNSEAIFLLLQHAFDNLKVLRVTWKCDTLNEPSVKSALSHGAKKEGVLRNHYRYSGSDRRRDSAYFSWIDSEWEEAKALIQKKIGS